MNTDRRRHRRQRGQDRRLPGARPRRGRPGRRLPGAGRERLSARGPAAEDPLPGRRQARARRDRRRGAATWSRWSGSPSTPTTSTTRSPCWPTGACRASTARCSCPTTASSTSSATSRSATRPRSLRVNGATLGLTICEDIWEPGPPASDEALAGAEVIVNISASPYHHGKGAQRERMLIQRARDNLAYVVFCNLVGGQDELVFDGYSLVVDQDGELVARGAQFDEELIVCDIDPSTAQRVRLRDARHRPAARGRRRGPDAGRGWRRPPRHGATEVGGPRAKPLDPDAEVYAALCAGGARLRRQERLPARAARPVGRDRLRAHGLHRGRRAGPRASRLRRDALPPLLRGNPAGRAARSRTTSASSATSCQLEAAMRGLRRGARRGVRGHGAGHRRGEHPGPHPRATC